MSVRGLEGEEGGGIGDVFRGLGGCGVGTKSKGGRDVEALRPAGVCVNEEEEEEEEEKTGGLVSR